ncbi:MAG: hypothetical protein LUF01_14525 [Bacteroides sp.]|nr:hypothetical protein [Bacteroides sp.]
MELGKNTMILMADGTSKAIQNVFIGDRVMSGSGSNIVGDIIKGPQKYLVAIEVQSGQKLCTTKDSFIETRDGIIPVGKLRVSDFLKTENGLVEVAEISIVDYNDCAYILSLDGATYIANEIFIVGDDKWMNNQYGLQNNNNHQMPKSVLDEIEQIRKEIHDQNIGL